MLLEREEQLADLAGWYDAALTAGGELVLVSGHAGSGKSSMVREFTASRASWTGWCDPLATPRPLGPLLDIARQSGLDTSPTDPFDLYAAFLDRITDDRLVIVIEDVHWADAATLAMLQYLGRRIGQTRSLVLATYRDDEIVADHPLRPVLADLARQRDVRRLAVGPLSVEAVSSLAAAAGLDGAAVHATTGGNAFYVTEVVAGGGSVTVTVRDAVLERLLRLDDDGRRLVEAVAADARGLELDLVEPWTGLGPDVVDRVTSAGVLEVQGASLRFRHDLARQAAYDAIPVPRRIRLHLSMVDLLAGRHSTDHARLAHHALGSADPRLIALHAHAAGLDALRRDANREAVAFLRAVADHADQVQPPEAIRVQLDLGVALGRVDRQQQSVEAIRSAAALATELGDRELIAESLTVLARSLWRSGDTITSWARLDQAIDAVRPLGPTRALSEALRVKGHHAMLARHHALAMGLTREARTVADAIGAVPSSIRAQLIEGTIELVTGDADLGIELLVGARTRAAEIGDHQIDVECLWMLGSGAGEARRYEQALGWIAEELAFEEDRDQDYAVAYAEAWQARIAVEQGRWDDATALTRRTRVGEVAPVSRVTILGALGRLRVRRGDPRPDEPLCEALTLADQVELQHSWPSVVAWAELHWLEGRFEEGATLVRPYYERSLATDSPWAQGELGTWLWRCGGLDTPPPAAAAPCAAQISGDWRRAAQLWHEIGCPYDEGLALLDGDAPAVLDALAIFERLGAAPATRTARTRLRDLGAAVPPARRTFTRAHPLGLTAREAEVHALLVEGLNNNDIARRLVLSVRTVEHHVAAVLAKAGVGSRAELAR